MVLMRVLVAGAIALVSSHAASATLIQDSSPNTPYLHYPPYRRHDGAFASTQPQAHKPRLSFSVAEPERPMNPVRAWDRHPQVPAPLEQHKVGRKTKRDVISESNAPFPPSACKHPPLTLTLASVASHLGHAPHPGVDINNLTTIALIAQAAVARMQTWYEDGVFE